MSVELRRFRWIFPSLLTVVGCVVYFGAGQPRLATGVFGFAAAFLLASLASPTFLRIFHAIWTSATRPLASLTTHAALGLVYHGVLIPLAILAGLGGRDRLKRKFDPAAASYWARREAPQDLDRYFRQY